MSDAMAGPYSVHYPGDGFWYLRGINVPPTGIGSIDGPYLAERIASALNIAYHAGRDSRREPTEAKLAKAQEITDFAWLIEMRMNYEPVYYGKTDEGLDWTSNHYDAIRYARREDAQAVIDDFGWTEAKAVEHSWG